MAKIKSISEIMSLELVSIEETIKRRGKEMTFTLRLLTAEDMERIKIKYPIPFPPVKDIDGVPMPDDMDPDYRADFRDALFDQAVAAVCLMLGDSFFKSQDIKKQAAELKKNFTEREINILFSAGVERDQISEDDMKRAKDKISPFGGAGKKRGGATGSGK